MRIPIITFSISIVFLCILTKAYSQFPPAAGSPGTTAMFADSSAFCGWARECFVNRGYVSISDTTFTYNGSNRATFGQTSDALGKADNLVVSLGDGGSAVLTFDHFIINGPGFDFAVFENSMDGSFLELGFVEVSSDGDNFYRFPSASLTPADNQVHTFGSIDPTKIDNLAGKYLQLFGTPFDLDTLKGTAGLDINRITHIKITDVVGNIVDPYATFDSRSNRINDPWPTPFNTGGFDLDAVGVINGIPNSMPDLPSTSGINIFPDPVSDFLTIEIPDHSKVDVILFNCCGTRIHEIRKISGIAKIDLTSFSKGLYFTWIVFPDGAKEVHKLIKL